jgi:hypothetical protein
MTQNLFAACRVRNQLVAKRVRMDAATQRAVHAMFDAQERSFRNGIISELPYDGSYTPDDDELLTLPVPQEAAVFSATIQANATSIPDINASAFATEGIKGLFTGRIVNGSPIVLVQRFTAAQVLQTKFALFQQGNAFSQLSDPAFTLDSSLTCVIENSNIKFKSQQKLRSIIHMLDIYRAATDQEVRSFAGHSRIEVTDINGFIAAANQPSRRLIHAVASNRVLDTISLPTIQTAAQNTGLHIVLNNGKIVMPTDKKDIKALLQFLNESRYVGPLSGQTYVANSRRAA